MSVTGYHRASIAEREQLLAEIDRLTGSHVLHGSESLCKLLRYLADHALKHPGVALKEYQIATEVFGRPADFDPHLDSLVRVQAGRLRTKLSEYYASEGIGDSIVVELPKGTYTLAFHPAPLSAKAIVGNAPERERSQSSSPSSRTSKVVLALSIMLATAIVIIVALMVSKVSGGGAALS